MPKTYYDSELTAEQIEDALKAIHGVVTPSNNGKVLAISNGAIVAKSASEWGHGAVLEPLSITANGDYTPPPGTDGFDEVHVAVPSATLTTKSITQNGTYNASSDNADGYSSVTVNVSGGGSAVVQPLSVTENGTYTPPSGVDGYAPVTVNVSGGSGETYAFVVVDYPVGATCTASNGSVLITAPDTSGHAVFAIPSAGTWTISAVKDGNSSAEQVVISIYGTSDNIILYILPSEYTRVQYLESSGTQYINTGLPMKNDVKIILVEQGLNVSNSLHGVYTNSSTGLQIGCLNSQVCIGFGTTVSIGVAYDISQSHEFIIDTPASLVSFDGNEYSKAYTSGQSGNIVLFGVYAQDRSTIDKHQARCYKYKYYLNGSLEMSLVPCYRKADNKPGMYDLINNVFYTNNGTGEFILGPEV